MSADVLRQAAALMRERAEAATPSPWHQDQAQDGEILADGTGYVGDYEPTSEVYAMDVAGHCVMEFHAGSTQDAEHIASWHPAVALAVADWLDAQADISVTYGHPMADGTPVIIHGPDPHAFAVARVYLGESA